VTEFPSLSTSWRGGGVGLPHLALGKMAVKCFFADPNDAAARTDAVMSESSRLQKIANCLLRQIVFSDTLRRSAASLIVIMVSLGLWLDFCDIQKSLRSTWLPLLRSTS
jgi:hypothetical protein